MRYALSPKPVLGPCPCTTRGEPLFWARRTTRVDNEQVYNGLLWWRGWHGRIHRCGSDRRVIRNCRNSTRRRHSQIAHETAHHMPIGYNRAVGSSDESNTIADGARVLATTHDAGVIAFRGSSS